MKNKEKGKAKQSKTIIMEEEDELLPPALPPAGKPLADVLAGLSLGDLNNVVGHLSPSTLKNWIHSIGFRHESVCG